MTHFHSRVLSWLLTAALLLPLVLMLPSGARAADDWVEEDHFPRVTYVATEELPLYHAVPGAALSFTRQSVTIRQGIGYALKSLLVSETGTDEVRWQTSDPGVVSVDRSGVVSGVTVGSAWVTALLGDVQALIYVYVDANSLVKQEEFPYYIKVNKSTNSITVYAKDVAGEYTVPLRTFRCSTGKNTPNGLQKIRNHNAWNGLYGDYEGLWSSWIVSFFLFHSVPYYHRTHDSLNVKYYNEFGTTCSGGCVRLQALNAKWIYDNCPVGTQVEFYYDEENPGPLGLQEAIRLPEGLKWDPTDPLEENPWLFGGVPEIHDAPSELHVALGGEEPDFLAGVTGTDTLGNDISGSVRVKTDLDLNAPGRYLAVYSLTDASYKTVYAYCTIYVEG